MQIAATTVEKSAQDIRKKYTSGTHVAKYKMTNAKIQMSKYDLQFASTSLQSRDQYKMSRKKSLPALHKKKLRIYTHTQIHMTQL